MSLCIRHFILTMYFLFVFDLSFFWSIRSIVEISHLTLLNVQYFSLICIMLLLSTELDDKKFESNGFVSKLVSFSSCKLNQGVVFFEIPQSRHVCPQGIPSRSSLWFFSIRSSVFLSSLWTFFHFPVTSFTDHSLCNSCIPRFALYFTIKASHYAEHIPWHCSTTLPHSHFHILLHRGFFSGVSCTFCHWARNFYHWARNFCHWALTSVIEHVTSVIEH